MICIANWFEINHIASYVVSLPVDLCRWATVTLASCPAFLFIFIMNSIIMTITILVIKTETDPVIAPVGTDPLSPSLLLTSLLRLGLTVSLVLKLKLKLVGGVLGLQSAK